MSNPPERPWTEEEKYALLTEILKKAGVPSISLFKMINDLRISPSWTEIPLPPGRSLSSCQSAYNNMSVQAFGLVPQGISTTRVPPLDTDISRKRPIQPLDRIFPAIQPRPSSLSSSPYGPEGTSRMQLAPGLEPMSAGRGEPRPKRGRPTKAETERRRAVAHARGEEYPPRRSGAARPRNPPTPSGAGSVTSEGPVLSPKPAIHNLETKAMETASVETSGTSIEARRERPVEDPTQEQMESASVPASAQGELWSQAGTLPSLQSMQLGLGGDTPRTIPGATGARPLGPPLFSYPEASWTIPSGAGTSNPGRPRGLDLEILAGTSGTQETTRRESGPSESGT